MTVQRICAGCGLVMVVLFLAGFAIAGWLPPPKPSESAAQAADRLRSDAGQIRLGCFLMLWSSVLLGCWSVSIALETREIEGPRAPLTMLQLLFGALLILEFVVPLMIWEAVVYRPGGAELEQQINDISWLMYVGVAYTATAQAIVMGLAMLQDHRDEPRFPRWAGYFSIWVGVLLAPGSFVVFFKSGPLAWNGLLAFWIPLTVFCAWIVVTSALVIVGGRKGQHSSARARA